MAVIPYAAQTWTDAVSDVSGARMTVMEAGILAAHLQPAVSVYHNANQSINNATATALAFNSERLDTAAGVADTQHDTVTNNSRLTCRYAGVYQITANIEWAATANTGLRDLYLRVGGTTIIAYTKTPASTISVTYQQNVTRLYTLAVNDYVEAVVLQTSGAALPVQATGNYSPEFMMVRVA